MTPVAVHTLKIALYNRYAQKSSTKRGGFSNFCYTKTFFQEEDLRRKGASTMLPSAAFTLKRAHHNRYAQKSPTKKGVLANICCTKSFFHYHFLSGTRASTKGEHLRWRQLLHTLSKEPNIIDTLKRALRKEGGFQISAALSPCFRKRRNNRRRAVHLQGLHTRSKEPDIIDTLKRAQQKEVCFQISAPLSTSFQISAPLSTSFQISAPLSTCPRKRSHTKWRAPHLHRHQLPHTRSKEPYIINTLKKALAKRGVFKNLLRCHRLSGRGATPKRRSAHLHRRPLPRIH